MSDHASDVSSRHSGEGLAVFTVGVTDGGSELSEVFAGNNGEIVEELPFNNFQVRFPDAMRDEIEALESVKAVNREGRLRFE
jgi:hypothetical protein